MFLLSFRVFPLFQTCGLVVCRLLWTVGTLVGIAVFTHTLLLLTLPAQPRLCNNTASHVSTAQQLTMGADPDTCKSLQGRGPVLPDAGSPFTPGDAPFARCGQLWTAYNGTYVACQFAGQLIEANPAPDGGGQGEGGVKGGPLETWEGGGRM